MVEERKKWRDSAVKLPVMCVKSNNKVLFQELLNDHASSFLAHSYSGCEYTTAVTVQLPMQKLFVRRLGEQVCDSLQKREGKPEENEGSAAGQV